jgi:probable blue pigment (indigoidine) exporter
LSLLAASAVTAGTLMVRRLDGVDVVVLSAAHLLFGGIVLAGAALAIEGAPNIAWTPRFVAVLLFLGILATAATTLAWFVETQRCALSSLTPWMFLVPVFGLVIGFVVLGERPDAWTVAGITLVLIGLRVALSQHAIAGAGPGHLHITKEPSQPGERRRNLSLPGSGATSGPRRAT